MNCLTEISRILYHLDLFRRNFRKGHSCANNSFCTLCAFKELFEELSFAMRVTAPDPGSITRLIQDKMNQFVFCCHSDPGRVYENLMRSIPINNDYKLHFSLTKICLECRTTSHVDDVVQFVNIVEGPVIPESPSFEFTIKTSLDSSEFCVKPNCFGNTKIFRTLKSEPPLLTLQFSPEFKLSDLEYKLRPFLIFECQSSSLLLTGVLIKNINYASLFFHTRLNTWIFIDEGRIELLASSWDVVKLNFSQYRPIMGFYLKREENMERIYENWPLDSDSGQGSSELSSIEETNVVEQKYATIKRNKRSKSNPISVSTPDLSRLDLRKVSFNCEVELVEDEEYMPHPILLSIMEKLKI
ncbi:unnamed protein product [Allacma fusca]|uniref:Uncharacterized protein n=1 Tax=Allacma fusca TaxID=39272 RepID=A0A8J2JZE2_9HEXA|nr:unnamed protein product [Allacma fusca]